MTQGIKFDKTKTKSVKSKLSGKKRTREESNVNDPKTEVVDYESDKEMDAIKAEIAQLKSDLQTSDDPELLKEFVSFCVNL